MSTPERVTPPCLLQWLRDIDGNEPDPESESESESDSKPEFVPFQDLTHRLRKDVAAVEGLCLIANGSPRDASDWSGLDVVSRAPEMRDFEGLFEELEVYSSLKMLVLLGCEEDICDYSAAASAIAKLLLSEKSSIVQIYLDGINIGIGGAEMIGGALSTNSTLKKLSVYRCYTGDEGGCALAKGLCNNSSIEHFGIDVLWNSTAEAFADVICGNETIKELDLSNNCFGSDDWALIGEALCGNTTLRHLFLTNSVVACSDEDESAFEKSVATTLAKVIQKNRSLQVLDIDGFVIGGVQSAEMISRALQENTSLSDVCIGDLSSLSDIAASHFASALNTNHTLQYFSGTVPSEAVQERIDKLLSYNHIGPITARARKTGECPAECFRRSIPSPQTPSLLACLEDIGGERGTSLLYHLVREHKSILALIKSCAETNRRKRKRGDGMA